MWVIAVTTYRLLIETILPLSYCSQTIFKLKFFLYFSTSHTFIFIRIPFHSATTRNFDSSTKKVQAGKQSPANLLYDKGLIRKVTATFCQVMGIIGIWESFTNSWKHMRQGERWREKCVNWAERMVLTYTLKKSWSNITRLQVGSILHIN